MENRFWEQPQQYNLENLYFTTLFYGIYVVIFSASIYIIICRSRVNKPLLLTTVTLFAICTAQTITFFLQAFLTTGVLANGYYSEIQSVSSSRMKNTYGLLDCISDAFAATNNLVADGLLIWRCFVVWDRRYSVVVTPVVTLIAGTFFAYAHVVIQVKSYLLRLHAPLSEVEAPPEFVELEHLNDYATSANYAISFVTNLLTTLLIAGKIWWTTRETRQYFGSSHGRKYHRVASLIVESGSIYSVCLLLLAIFYRLRHPSTSKAMSIIQAITYQIAGIFPTLIIVLVALGRTFDMTTIDNSSIFDGQAVTSKFTHPSAASDVTANIHNVDLQEAETLREYPEHSHEMAVAAAEYENSV